MMKLIRAVLSGTVLVTCVAMKPVSLDISSAASETSVLTKTVFSSNMRLVMPVGVEGTGHAFVVSVMKHMFRTSEQLVPIPEKYIVSSRPYHIRTSMNANALQYSAALDDARNQMRKMATRAAKVRFPGTMATFQNKNSYPDGNPPDKVMKYFDLRVLAGVAEEEGVDFRVLYLKRSAKDLIIANTVHRHFQNSRGKKGEDTPEQRYLEYMQILLTDTAVMHSYLAELDPAFVVCHDYDLIGDVQQASTVAGFLAPNAVVAELLQKSFVAMARVRHASNETLPYEGADVITARLQLKLDSFESFLCTGG